LAVFFALQIARNIVVKPTIQTVYVYLPLTAHQPKIFYKTLAFQQVFSLITTSYRMNYIKPLDGIRAIAAFLVVVWHWIPQESFVNQFPNGFFGVNLFFVLSGFLITSILLTNRKEAEVLGQSRKTVLRNFYIRRVLRIFPIYYLTILLMIVLRYPAEFKLSMSELLASATYTYNFYLFTIKSWSLASVHFWSLAVEEQFYLIWPLLMLFLPQRFLIHGILLFILIGVSSQSLLTDRDFGPLLPHTCFDCLGIGGLLAWVVINKPSYLQRFYHLTSLLALTSVALLVLHQLGTIYLIQDRFAHAMIGVWVITHVLLHNQKQSILTSFLSTKVLVSLGKVSYGVYLYHILYYYLAHRVWKIYIMPHFQDIQPIYLDWAFLVINIGILYWICLLSWRFIEKPILQVKDKFNYQKSDAHTSIPAIPKTERMEPL
jgi:peptidoglycan/LPS O-acetylase OafA/YrhL